MAANYLHAAHLSLTPAEQSLPGEVAAPVPGDDHVPDDVEVPHDEAPGTEADTAGLVGGGRPVLVWCHTPNILQRPGLG